MNTHVEALPFETSFEAVHLWVTGDSMRGWVGDRIVLFGRLSQQHAQSARVRTVLRVHEGGVRGARVPST